MDLSNLNAAIPKNRRVLENFQQNLASVNGAKPEEYKKTATDFINPLKGFVNYGGYMNIFNPSNRARFYENTESMNADRPQVTFDDFKSFQSPAITSAANGYEF